MLSHMLFGLGYHWNLLDRELVKVWLHNGECRVLGTEETECNRCRRAPDEQTSFITHQEKKKEKLEHNMKSWGEEEELLWDFPSAALQNFFFGKCKY